MRTVVLDDELAALLEGEKPLDQAARETLVMDLFRRGNSPLARPVGLDRARFARRAAELDIPYFQMTREDWERERAAIDAWQKS